MFAMQGAAVLPGRSHREALRLPQRLVRFVKQRVQRQPRAQTEAADKAGQRRGARTARLAH